MLERRFLSLVYRYLPDFLICRIDPFSATIDSFVHRIASETPNSVWVLDAGAGEAIYRGFFLGANYVALDNGRGDEDWDYSRLDILADLNDLPFKPQIFYSVLCIVVLEHLADPQQSLREIYRILRADGKLYLAVPQSWELHQKPYDYLRFTRYGLERLLTTNGFLIEYLEPIGGYFWYISRRLMYLLHFLQKGWKRALFVLLAPILGLMIPLACYYLDRWDRDRDHTLGYLCIARKSVAGERE